MVGRDLPAREAHVRPTSAAPLLTLRNWTRRPCFEGISLSLRPGEVVGLFGLVGSGRSELLETLVGLHGADEGVFELDGRAVRFGSPRRAARAGLVLVPEERQRQGLLFNLGLADNLALPRAVADGDVVLRRERERRAGEGLLAEWRIKASGVDATPDTLSGGNQQKVVLARWLATRPRVLLLDEPTKGVDVGAKYEIHGIIRRVAEEGAACLVVSSDLPEVLALADRILVMREGRLQGEIAAEDASEESVMHLATADEGHAA
jgi:ABC-type sugar transport system ATPase subunit